MNKPGNSRVLLLLVISFFFCKAAEPVSNVSAAENCSKLNVQGCNGSGGRICKWSLGGDRGCFLLRSSRLQSGQEAGLVAQAVVDIDRESKEACGIRLTIQTMNMADVDAKGFCMEEHVSIDYCVPEGGARFCGNKSHGTCKLLPEQGN